MQHTGRWDSHLGRGVGVLLEKAEVIQHRMRGKSDLADHAQPFPLCFDASSESNAVIGGERFHTIQPLQKIEVPHGAAEFAVSGAAESHCRLFGYDGLNRGVFRGAEIFL